MKIRIKNKEFVLDCVLFILSCINTNLIYVYLFAVFLKMREGSVGFIKVNMMYLIRQVFYFPGLASITSTQSNVKLVLLALAAGYTLFNYLKKNAYCIPRYMGFIVLFGVVASASAVFFGSFPVAATVKVLSFTIVFLSTVIAVNECNEFFDVESYVYHWLSGVVFVSFFLIPIKNAYLLGSSGLLFRGIWNHPNDFGVACVMYLAMLLVRCRYVSIKQLLNILCVFIMVFLSKARGAMLSAVGVIAVYYFFCKNKNERSLIIFMAFALAVVAVVSPLGGEIVDFIIKGSNRETFSRDIFSSRTEIFNVAMTRFKSNPLLGRGLLISYIPGVKNLALFENGTEPGNIVLELLAGTGLAGLIVFSQLIMRFYRMAIGKKKIYTLVAMLASISEVSFFSVNNYAFLYYILIAFSIISHNEERVPIQGRASE